MKIIKAVEKKRYTIELVQASSGLFYVKYSRQGLKDPVVSESMKDLNIALYVFDAKVDEFEGH